MVPPHGLAVGEIGERPRYAEHAVETSPREPESVDRAPEDGTNVGVQVDGLRE
jgi:hypothetical protein